MLKGVFGSHLKVSKVFTMLTDSGKLFQKFWTGNKKFNLWTWFWSVEWCSHDRCLNKDDAMIHSGKQCMSMSWLWWFLTLWSSDTFSKQHYRAKKPSGDRNPPPRPTTNKKLLSLPMQPGFMSRSLHASIQVSVCSGYNLGFGPSWLTSRDMLTHRQHLTSIF